MPRVPFDPAIDYYQLLGVRPGASNAEIQAAYRQLAKANHPDLHAGSAAAAARMARLNAAKSVLLDRATRARYDELRAVRRGVASVVRPQARTQYVRGSAAVQTAPRSTYASAPPPTYRVTATPMHRRRIGGSFDRQTGILLLLVLPLVAALVVYVLQAVQESAQPLRAGPSDLALVPNARPTAHGTAEAVFMMVHTQPMSRSLARQALNFIASRTDSTPESEVLRAEGRRLVQAATVGDSAEWETVVLDLCQLAGRCGTPP